MTDNLTHLGKQSPIERDPNNVILDRIVNPSPALLYSCRFTAPEFTSLCPKTGQPDFATMVIDYVPNKFLLESKSLKLLLFAYRDRGDFHEKCTTEIGERIYNTIEPHWFRIAGFWNARGGISIDVVWEAGNLPNGVRALDVNAVPAYKSRG
jgi:7-cyano-7-deazaguanine reductase